MDEGGNTPQSDSELLEDAKDRKLPKWEDDCMIKLVKISN